MEFKLRTSMKNHRTSGNCFQQVKSAWNQCTLDQHKALFLNSQRTKVFKSVLLLTQIPTSESSPDGWKSFTNMGGEGTSRKGTSCKIRPMKFNDSTLEGFYTGQGHGNVGAELEQCCDAVLSLWPYCFYGIRVRRNLENVSPVFLLYIRNSEGPRDVKVTPCLQFAGSRISSLFLFLPCFLLWGWDRI